MKVISLTVSLVPPKYTWHKWAILLIVLGNRWNSLLRSHHFLKGIWDPKPLTVPFLQALQGSRHLSPWVLTLAIPFVCLQVLPGSLVLPLSYCLLFQGAPIFPFCSKGCSCDCSLMHGCGCTFPSGDSRSLESSEERLTCDVVGGRRPCSAGDNTCIPFVCSCQKEKACPQSPFNSTSQKFGISEDSE